MISYHLWLVLADTPRYSSTGNKEVVYSSNTLIMSSQSYFLGPLTWQGTRTWIRPGNCMLRYISACQLIGIISEQFPYPRHPGKQVELAAVQLSQGSLQLSLRPRGLKFPSLQPF